MWNCFPPALLSKTSLIGEEGWRCVLCVCWWVTLVCMLRLAISFLKWEIHVPMKLVRWVGRRISPELGLAEGPCSCIRGRTGTTCSSWGLACPLLLACGSYLLWALWVCSLEFGPCVILRYIFFFLYWSLQRRSLVSVGSVRAVF